ncbi:MAG: hypothetical protein DWQ36_24690 [Acidobacteria bacterium]|nr:MAG: hypothetical protein DWQ30_10730 [Acidobacteriota bacterium]REJ99537.1 MAG: hypothetical protein DWQ36_24690 [Acidobacteriota bacterium]
MTDPPRPSPTAEPTTRSAAAAFGEAAVAGRGADRPNGPGGWHRGLAAATLAIGLAIFHGGWLAGLADGAERAADRPLVLTALLAMVLATTSRRDRAAREVRDRAALAGVLVATLSATLLPIAPLRSALIAAGVVATLAAALQGLELRRRGLTFVLRRWAFCVAAHLALDGGWLLLSASDPPLASLLPAQLAPTFELLTAGAIAALLLPALATVFGTATRTLLAMVAVVAAGFTPAALVALVASTWLLAPNAPVQEGGKPIVPLPADPGLRRRLGGAAALCAVLDPLASLLVALVALVAAAVAVRRLRLALLLVAGAVVALLPGRPLDLMVRELALLVPLLPLGVAAARSATQSGALRRSDGDPEAAGTPPREPDDGASTSGPLDLVMTLAAGLLALRVAPPSVALLAPAALLAARAGRPLDRSALAALAAVLAFLALPPLSLDVADLGVLLLRFEAWLPWLAATLLGATLAASLHRGARLSAAVLGAAAAMLFVQPWSLRPLHRWPPIDLTAQSPEMVLATDSGRVLVLEGALSYRPELGPLPVATLHDGGGALLARFVAGRDLGDWAARRSRIREPHGAISLPAATAAPAPVGAFLAQRYRWHVELPPATRRLVVKRHPDLDPAVLLTIDRAWRRAARPGERCFVGVAPATVAANGPCR